MRTTVSFVVQQNMNFHNLFSSTRQDGFFCTLLQICMNADFHVVLPLKIRSHQSSTGELVTFMPKITTLIKLMHLSIHLTKPLMLVKKNKKLLN